MGVQTQQMSVPIDGTYGVRTGMDTRTMYDPDWQLNSDILQDLHALRQILEEEAQGDD